MFLNISQTLDSYVGLLRLSSCYRMRQPVRAEYSTAVRFIYRLGRCYVSPRAGGRAGTELILDLYCSLLQYNTAPIHIGVKCKYRCAGVIYALVSGLMCGSNITNKRNISTWSAMHYSYFSLRGCGVDNEGSIKKSAFIYKISHSLR